MLTYAATGTSPAIPALRRASRATSMPHWIRFALAPSIRSILSACLAAIEMTRGPVGATPTGALGKFCNHWIRLASGVSARWSLSTSASGAKSTASPLR